MSMLGRLMKTKQLVEWDSAGETSTGRKPAPMPLYPPQISHGLIWDRTWAPRWVSNSFKLFVSVHRWDDFVFRGVQPFSASWLSMNDQKSGSLSSNCNWDITPCSPAKVNRHFERSYWKNKPRKKPEWSRQEHNSVLSVIKSAITNLAVSSVLLYRKHWRIINLATALNFFVTTRNKCTLPALLSGIGRLTLRMPITKEEEGSSCNHMAPLKSVAQFYIGSSNLLSE
jgi:hypothetical protein